MIDLETKPDDLEDIDWRGKKSLIKVLAISKHINRRSNEPRNCCLTKFCVSGIFSSAGEEILDLAVLRRLQRRRQLEEERRRCEECGGGGGPKGATVCRRRHHRCGWKNAKVSSAWRVPKQCPNAPARHCILEWTECERMSRSNIVTPV